MRIALIGLDAANVGLLTRAVEAGVMPVLTELLQRGKGLRLKSDAEPFPGSAWPTLFTGTSVAEHRRFFNLRLRSGTYAIQDVVPEDLGRPPFWKHVSDAGLGSTVMSIYGAPLLGDFRGVQVVGWGTHDPYATKVMPARASPPEVLGWLDEAAPERHRGFLARPPVTVADMTGLRDAMIAGLEQHAEAAASLARRTDWDFFATSFSELHQSGHFMWHLDDPASAGFDRMPELQGSMLRIYEAADAALGRVLEALPDDTTVIVCSPHGMGAMQIVGDPAPLLLEAAGLLVRRSAMKIDRGGALLVARKAVRSLLPLPVRQGLGARMRRTRAHLNATTYLASVDVERSRAFSLPTDGPSFIRVNLRGRDPAGIVSPGPEYEEVCDALEGLMAGLVDARTGLPAAKRVVRPARDLGIDDDSFPDLVVVWDAASPIERLSSPVVGDIDVPKEYRLTGFHRPEGFFVAAGSGIEPSGVAQILGSEARIVDVAPTVLKLLGVPVPEQLAGRPIGSVTALRSPAAK